MIRFQADVNINIVRGVLRREPTIDFQTAQEANLVGLKDDLALKKNRKRRANTCNTRSKDDANSFL